MRLAPLLLALTACTPAPAPAPAPAHVHEKKPLGHTFEGDRRRFVVTKAREAQAHAVKSGHGLYGRPRKPATSGRKKKAA